MNCGKLGGALFALPFALLLSGCETANYSTAGATMGGPAMATSALDGTWSSNDGVFYATFSGGQFISRFTQTDEILAQGSYAVSGSRVNLEWVSVASQQQRTAECRTLAPDAMSCKQQGGGDFELKRGA